MKRSGVFLFFIVALCVWAGNAHALVIETNEWSNRTQTGWIYTQGRPNIDSSVTSPSGGSTLRFDYTAGTYTDASTSGGKAEFGNLTGRDLYVGHWVKWSSNWVWHSVGSKIDYQWIAVPSFTTGQNACFTIHILPDGRTVVLTSNISGNGVFSSLPHDYRVTLPSAFQFNRWYWIEYHVRLNDVTADLNPPTFANVVPNGLIEFWVDDIPRLSRTDVRFTDRVNQSWKTFLHSPEWGGGSPGGIIPEPGISLWVDHTVISTTRIGRPGGAGDTTAPATPAGWIVR